MRLNRPFATVTPTLDGDVLAVLAATSETFTISQIHRILATASAEGIRKTLLRLTTQGIVHHDRVGRTNTFRLNTEHLAAEPIRALARLTDTFLDRIQAHLDSWPEPPLYAAVFGSAATATMTVDSDIDIFIVRDTPPADAHTETETWEQQVTELARAVTAWTGNDTRVVEYTEADLQHAAAVREPLLHDVAQQGLTVAGTRSWLTRQLPTAGRNAATGSSSRSPGSGADRNQRRAVGG